MNQIIYLMLLILLSLNVYAHVHASEEGEEHEEHEEEKEFSVLNNVIGIAVIFLSSFCGTVIPVLFRKKSFFSSTSVIFGSIKLFGVGVIISVAFIHMLIPADQLLTSTSAGYFFKETYPCFAGAFAIIGIIITHGIQVLTTHILHQRNIKKQLSNSDDGSDSEQTVSANSSTLGEREKGMVVHDHDHHDHDCCANDLKAICNNVETKEKQMVSYLLEIGISIHSVLIGFVFGMAHGDEFVPLLVAMMFHQFFEGVALSSIFLEAKFKRLNASIVMIIVYTLTMPIGGLIGLLVRESYDEDSNVMIGLQGGVDAIAAGILIFDSLANVLITHTNSSEWRGMNLNKKTVQLIFFYLGLGVMALIGVWA